MYCPACGHHHRSADTKCQAIAHEPDDGGARRCSCPNIHQPPPERRTAS